MAGIQTNSPGDRKKLIAAIALGVIAIIVLSYALFGSSGGSSKPANPRVVGITPSPTPGVLKTTASLPDEIPQPIPPVLVSAVAPEPGRDPVTANILELGRFLAYHAHVPIDVVVRYVSEPSAD